MDQKCLPSWRNPARYPTSPDADAFVHASHLMGGVHQRGGRRAAHRAAHRGAVGHERSGRSILKLTSLCRCAGPQEAAFCVLRAMRHRGCYGIGGRVFEHRGGRSAEIGRRDTRKPERGRRPQAPSQGDSWVILVEAVGFEPTSEKLPRAALQPVETSLAPEGLSLLPEVSSPSLSLASLPPKGATRW